MLLAFPVMRFTTLLFALTLSFAAVAQNVEPNDLISPQTGTNRIIIPVAGAIAGGGNTFFRSDINVINFRNADQRVELHWLPQGSAGDSVADRVISVGARSGFSSEDFVTNILNQSGLGAIEIIATTATGEVDPAGQLHATARVWTPVPNSTAQNPGTMSQTFPAIVLTTSNVQTKWIFGVRRDLDRYRLNAGITNNSTVGQRFRITTIGSQTGGGETVELEVPARSMQQINLPGSANGAFQIIVQNISVTTVVTSWQAWASSVDNVTGDAWSQVAFPAPAP
ncbi:MAG TPA: hypothetical protein VF111_14955 [Thermoanaerobaculia bacterium]